MLRASLIAKAVFARALFGMALLVAGCAGPSLAQGPAGLGIRGAAPYSFAPLVKRVIPAVVNISVVEQSDDPPGSRQRGRRGEATLGAGSGFIVDPSGVIVTNTHVVGHANRISVTLADGTELQAQMIGTDELTDIAVIRVSSPTPLPLRAVGRQPRGGGGRLDPGRGQPVRRGHQRGRRASSPPAAATSAPGRSTISCRSTPPSTPATPAAPPSTWRARWSP